jgi:hypothetical protein
MTVYHSIGDFDEDGDVCDTGVFLHSGYGRIRVAESVTEYEQILKKLLNSVPDMRDVSPFDRDRKGG